MTILDAIRRANSRKESVKVQRIVDVKAFYLSLYRIEMIKLYDMGYILDPTKFKEQEFYGNIADMNIEEMFDSAGTIQLTSKQAQFALYKNKGDSETSEFLKMLYNCLLYREYCIDIDKFWEEQATPIETSSIKPRLDLYMKGSCPDNRPNFDLSLGVTKCLTKWGYNIAEISINEYIWALSMNELGIPKEDWFEDGVLDSSLSHSEELDCIEGLLSGTLRARGGKYLSKLEDWLKDHKWSTKFTSAESSGLYKYIMAGNSEGIHYLFAQILTAIDEDETSSYIACHGPKIYYSSPTTTMKMPIGMFIIACDVNGSENFLPMGNVVFGYSGEVYSLQRLQEDEIAYAGCPIMLQVNKNTKKYYYDIEQTAIEFDSWFSSNNVDISFSEDDYNAAGSPRFGVDTPEKVIWDAYKNSLKSIDNLVAEIPVFPYKDFEKARMNVFKKVKEVQ